MQLSDLISFLPDKVFSAKKCSWVWDFGGLDIFTVGEASTLIKGAFFPDVATRCTRLNRISKTYSMLFFHVNIEL